MFCIRRVRIPAVSQSYRTFVKVGDKVPVNYLKDVPAPTIKEDGEYPDWLFKLTEKDLTLNQLTSKMEEGGVMSLDKREMMRAKRMITLKDIKEANATSSSSL